MADDKTSTSSLSQPLSLNQRHSRFLSAAQSKHITKISSGKENEGGRYLDQSFSSAADYDDDYVPDFCGIAEFDSPPLMSSNPVTDGTKTSMPNGHGDVVLKEDDNLCGIERPTVSCIDESLQNLEGESDNMHGTEGLSIYDGKGFAQNLAGLAEKEDKVVKVRVEGRRRLCKLANMQDHFPREVEEWKRDAEISVISDVDSPVMVKDPTESNYSSGGDENNIRDILNDLSSKFDILSIEKTRKPKRIDPTEIGCTKKREEYAEYESAASAFSVSSDSSLGTDVDSSVIPLNKHRETYYDESEDENSLMEEHKSNKLSMGVKIDAIKLAAGKFVSTKNSTMLKNTKKENEEHDDDDCVLIDEVVPEVPAQRSEEAKNVSRQLYEGDVEEEVADDFVLEQDHTVALSRKSIFRLPGIISKMLYPHQRDGLKWLWSLHCKGEGGILGDDMGLGKTMQICGYLAGLFHSRLIKRVLVVAPKTLLPHWTKELSVVGLSGKTREYFGTKVNARQYELQYVLQDKGVLLTTYDIVRNNAKSLSGNCYNGDDGGDDGGGEGDFIWDYLILDEGHLIKNPSTQRAKSLLMIPAAHRIIISGTPLQNNLKELWALFNFCCPKLLGEYKWFKDKYEKLINRGNERSASEREKNIGSTVAKDLREKIQPYFLRRLKSEVFCQENAETDSKLSKKNEIIVWLKLTTCQRKIYEAFLKSEIVLSAFDGSPLAALTILKKICDHPLLLTKRAAEDVLEGMDSILNQQDHGIAQQLAMHVADVAETFELVDKHGVSCKIVFIMSLLNDLIPKGHHVLIFSQTQKMLNLIQESLVSNGYEFMRIDGTTKVCDRVKIVNDFQEGHGASIFLLTSQVGGLGLTLTKADRVIVVDPAWNPSTDNQSVDRAYRIGQTKNVIVYRLMTCSTVEEKIYRMQIFKGGLFRTATEHKEQIRYFSKHDLQELFSLPKQGFDVSLTQKQMLEEHDQQYMMEESLKAHIEFLKSLSIAGLSQHSLLFSKAAPVTAAAADEEDPRVPRNTFINSTSGSSFQCDYGAQHAFHPKDIKKQQKKSSACTNEPTEDEIREKIYRLSQIIADKGTVSKLPDKGEKIRKQIDYLNLELNKLKVSKRTENDSNHLEEVSWDFQRMLNIKS